MSKPACYSEHGVASVAETARRVVMKAIQAERERVRDMQRVSRPESAFWKECEVALLLLHDTQVRTADLFLTATEEYR